MFVKLIFPDFMKGNIDVALLGMVILSTFIFRDVLKLFIKG